MTAGPGGNHVRHAGQGNCSGGNICKDHDKSNDAGRNRADRKNLAQIDIFANGIPDENLLHNKIDDPIDTADCMPP